MHGARANFGVVRLLKNAALSVPEVHEFEDEILEGEALGLGAGFRFYFRFHDNSKTTVPLQDGIKQLPFRAKKDSSLRRPRLPALGRIGGFGITRAGLTAV
jgi:hypothetical protein